MQYKRKAVFSSGLLCVAVLFILSYVFFGHFELAHHDSFDSSVIRVQIMHRE